MSAEAVMLCTQDDGTSVINSHHYGIKLLQMSLVQPRL